MKCPTCGKRMKLAAKIQSGDYVKGVPGTTLSYHWQCYPCVLRKETNAGENTNATQ